MLKAAGVRHIPFHDARHTRGTLMHLQDVPIAVISAWLGHASKAFTMATYLHDGHLYARAARGVEHSGAEFRASCDKPWQLRVTRTRKQTAKRA